MFFSLRAAKSVTDDRISSATPSAAAALIEAASEEMI